MAIEAVYSGQPAEGERAVAPFAKLGKPAAGKFSAKPYVEAQNGFTGASPPALPAGLGVYVKSGFVNSFSDKLLGDLIHGFENGPEWLDAIGFGLCAGAGGTGQAGRHGVLESGCEMGSAHGRRLV